MCTIYLTSTAAMWQKEDASFELHHYSELWCQVNKYVHVSPSMNASKLILQSAVGTCGTSTRPVLPVRLSAGAWGWRWTRSWTLHSSGQAGADWEPSAAAGQMTATWAGSGSPPPSSPGGRWRTLACGFRACESRGCGRSRWAGCRAWRRRTRGWRPRCGPSVNAQTLYLEKNQDTRLDYSDEGEREAGGENIQRRKTPSCGGNTLKGREKGGQMGKGGRTA